MKDIIKEVEKEIDKVDIKVCLTKDEIKKLKKNKAKKIVNQTIIKK